VTFQDASAVELAPIPKRLKAEQPEDPEPIKDVTYDKFYTCLFIL
jgi:hypothetical protein